MGVYRVPGEPATEVVVDAAGGHGVEGRGEHRDGTLGPRLAMSPEQELQRRCLGELGGAAESTVGRVEVGPDPGIGVDQGVVIGGSRVRRSRDGDGFGEAPRLVFEVRSAL